jgi:hypothetical protein
VEPMWWLVLRVEPELNPEMLRARRSGRMVIREAAVMATPGSTRVQTIAVVPVTTWIHSQKRAWVRDH